MPVTTVVDSRASPEKAADGTVKFALLVSEPEYLATPFVIRISSK